MRKLNRSLGGFFGILRGLCVARIGLGQGGRRRPRAVKETTLTLTLTLALALTLTQDRRLWPMYLPAKRNKKA